MTRFWLWVFISFGALVAGFFGLNRWDTSLSSIFFSGTALALHALFGEEA